jgi:hypothetical protein
MVAVYLPPAWLALVPIIVIESGYGTWRYKFPFGRSLAAQSVANLPIHADWNSNNLARSGRISRARVGWRCNPEVIAPYSQSCARVRMVGSRE